VLLNIILISSGFEYQSKLYAKLTMDKDHTGAIDTYLRFDISNNIRALVVDVDAIKVEPVLFSQIFQHLGMKTRLEVGQS